MPLSHRHSERGKHASDLCRERDHAGKKSEREKLRCRERCVCPRHREDRQAGGGREVPPSWAIAGRGWEVGEKLPRARGWCVFWCVCGNAGAGKRVRAGGRCFVFINQPAIPARNNHFSEELRDFIDEE